MPKMCSFSQNRTATRSRKMKNRFTEKKIVREHCRISLALLRTSQRQDPIEAARERTRVALKKLRRRDRKTDMNNIKTEAADFDADATELFPVQLNWKLSQCDATERDAGDGCHSSQSMSSWQEPREPQKGVVYDTDLDDLVHNQSSEYMRCSKKVKPSENVSPKRQKLTVNETKLPEIFRFFNNVEKARDCNAKPGAITATCNACHSRIKGFLTVTSNFIKHLRLKHFEIHAAFMSGKQVGRLEPPETEIVDTDSFDSRVIDYIIDTSQPLSTVDTASFRNLFKGSNLQILSQSKLEKQLDERYTKMCASIKHQLDQSKYVCMTADIWSSRECSFFGYTCHWLDRKYQRKSVALACKRFIGDKNQIFQIINDIHSKFELNNLKIVATIIYNDANYSKEFKHFGIKADIKSMQDEGNFEPMCGLLSTLTNEMQSTSYKLDRLASGGFIELLQFDKTLKERHVKVFEKCGLLWQKCSCPTTTEIILSILGSTLVTPTVTRWNSIYDAVCFILMHKLKLHKLCSKLCLHNSYFSASDFAYMEEYRLLMSPIASAIEFLRNENNVSYGCLLTTLISLYIKLKKVSESPEIVDLKNVAIYLLTKLETIFWDFFHLTNDANNAIIASVLCPNIKMRWFGMLEKVDLHSRNAEYIHNIVISEAVREAKAAEDLNKPALHQINYSNGNDEFYAFEEFDDSGGTNNLDTSQVSCISKLTENVTSQFQNYLRDPGTSFDTLEKYPLLLDLAIKHNTPLTSSAPVERLLSFMNIIRYSRRPDLSNYPFEKLVLLKANSSFSD